MTAPSRLEPNLDRHLALDVLRGFALFGILLVNFDWFTRALPEIVLGPSPGYTGLDRAVDLAIYTLATGKFYALFSMLFGAGFALMLDRATARAAPFWGTYLRRLAMLAVIGILSALVRRGVSGKGARLDLSLSEAALSWMGGVLTAAKRYGAGGRENDIINGGAAVQDARHRPAIRGDGP